MAFEAPEFPGRSFSSRAEYKKALDEQEALKEILSAEEVEVTAEAVKRNNVRSKSSSEVTE